MAQFVTLINRTTKTLKGTCDGKHYNITPGKHSFPEPIAQMFKSQNPIMGSEDPVTLEKEYLLGIEEHNDDCSPIEQSREIELFNRKKWGGPQVEVIPGRPGLFSKPGESSLPSGGTTAPISTAFTPADK